MYVYIKSEPGLWTVGFYKPDGKWEPESDHNDREEASKRVAWLNGSGRGENKTNTTSDILGRNALEFVWVNGLSNRLWSAIKSDEYYNNITWTVGNVYHNGLRIHRLGKKSLREFREKVDEIIQE